LTFTRKMIRFSMENNKSVYQWSGSMQTDRANLIESNAIAISLLMLAIIELILRFNKCLWHLLSQL
jgi:hypothetical protein